MKEKVYRVTNTSRIEFDLGATLSAGRGASSQIRKLWCLHKSLSCVNIFFTWNYIFSRLDINLTISQTPGFTPGSVHEKC
jgi:hypothetical protein